MFGNCHMEVPVWVSANGERMSVAAIASVVTKVAESNGIRASSRSLRIGGASAVAAAGADVATIQAIGGWVSGAFARYLRGVSFAAAGGSKAMGFS